jgi:dihydropyrimidinase
VSLLIRNGRVVSPEKDDVADIFVEKEFIAAIGTGLDDHADRVIDATGKYVIPGGIDVHTHLDAPVGNTVSSDDFETGTRAAAFGGTTSIIDFATQEPGRPLKDTLEVWWKKGEKSTLDYGLHMIITDLRAAPMDGIDEVVREGVTSFKLFMAYPGVLMVDDATILRVMRRAGELGALVCIHAENGSVIDLLVKEALAAGHTAPVYHALTRPTATEAEATHRAIALAQLARVPVYIVHVSCDESLREIARARSLGYPVFAETCPQYLFLSIDDLKRPGFEGAKYVLTPPLREQWNRERLWDGVQRNDLQIVSTDHCPFYFSGQKDKGRGDFTKIPNGGPGIENRLQLIYHYGVNAGRITVNRWVEVVSAAPAKLFGLYPEKGTIAVGSDADLVVWDPAKEEVISTRTHHMRVDYSMYEGFRVKGAPEIVVSRGEIIVDNEKWLGRPGRGKFVRRERFGLASGA